MYVGIVTEGVPSVTDYTPFWFKTSLHSIS